jgi:hypothetical protein
MLFILVCMSLLLLAGCADTRKETVTNNITNDTCTSTCHSETSAILGVKASYEASGHFNGPRTYAPKGGEEWTMFHGSNALYCNSGSSSGCAKCHTHDGFVDFVTTGSVVASNYPDPAEIQCFTCHHPHETGDFSLRTTAAVTLVDGTTTYDKGAGNLCVQCHISRTEVLTNFYDGTNKKGSYIRYFKIANAAVTSGTKDIDISGATITDYNGDAVTGAALKALWDGDNAAGSSTASLKTYIVNGSGNIAQNYTYGSTTLKGNSVTATR